MGKLHLELDKDQLWSWGIGSSLICVGIYRENNASLSGFRFFVSPLCPYVPTSISRNNCSLLFCFCFCHGGSRCGCFLFCFAVTAGHSQRLRILLAASEQRRTALMIAAESGRRETVDALVDIVGEGWTSGSELVRNLFRVLACFLNV